MQYEGFGRGFQRWGERTGTSGEGFHWPDVDEDISVRGLLEGVPAPRPR